MSKPRTKYQSVLALTAIALVACASVYFIGTLVPNMVMRTDSGNLSVSASQEIRKIVKTCPAADIRSIEVSILAGSEIANDPEATKNAYLQISPREQGGSRKEISLKVIGPILGSMDSRTIKTKVNCTTNGVELLAEITRSANYAGATLQNVLWRPQVTFIITSRTPNLVFQATWQMRLTTGEVLSHAETPPYPDQKYPITVTGTIPQN